jgi:hypothetical protein
MRLVLICGATGAGKDTVADAVVPRGHKARLALADPLREVVQGVLPIGRRDLTEDKDRAIAVLGNVTGRQVMQRLALAYRAVLPLAFAIQVSNKLRRLAVEGEVLATVTDIRDPGDWRFLMDTCQGFAEVRTVKLMRPKSVYNDYDAGVLAIAPDITIAEPSPEAAQRVMRNYLKDGW